MRRKICFCGGEEELKRKRRKIFEEGKKVFAKEKINGERRRKILGRRILLFVGEKKNEEGKGGKYLEKEKEENIWSRNRRKIFRERNFSRKRKKEEGKGGKYLEKQNFFFFGGEEKRRRKRTKIF